MVIFPVHFGAGYFGAHRPGSIPGGGFPIETSIGAAEPIRVSYVWDIRIGRLRLEAGWTKASWPNIPLLTVLYIYT